MLFPQCMCIGDGMRGVCEVRGAPEVLAHTVWLDCRQLAADAAEAESPQQSAAAEARAQLNDKVSPHTLLDPLLPSCRHTELCLLLDQR